MTEQSPTSWSAAPGVSGPQDSPYPDPVGKPTMPVATAPVTIAPAGPTPVTRLPAPTGPNWGLMGFGLVVVFVALGVVLNQVNGFEVRSLSSRGPTALVSVGLVCALFGMLGMFRRRRH